MKLTIQSVLQSALPLLALVHGAGCAAEEEPRGFTTEHHAGDRAGLVTEVRTGTIATAAGPVEISYELIDGLAVFQGDMIIPWSDFIDPHVAHAATVPRSNTWPNRRVPYVIDSSLLAPWRVTDAINHWHQNTEIQWVQRTNEPDYVRFVDGDGCSANAGRAGGEQKVTLSFWCSTGNAIHELGHAVGLMHEHSRQDRNNHVTIHWGNIESGRADQFNQYPGIVDVGTYDLGSIMQYSSDAFAKPFTWSITKLDGSQIVAQRDGLSSGDRLGVRVLYATKATGNTMQTGDMLAAGESLTSSNGLYRLVYQTDGNLVLYRTSNGAALWGLPISGAVSPGAVNMQRDGNFVVYSGSGSPYWSSATGGSGHRLVVQNDGNVVMYRPDGSSVWSTNTMQYPSGPAATGFDMYPGETLSPGNSLYSTNGQYQLAYQTDGNLVLYRTSNGAVLWATNTNGTPPGVLIMQTDGNLVLYRGTGGAIWSTGTNQTGSHLDVQNDGNLVIYSPSGAVVWARF